MFIVLPLANDTGPALVQVVAVSAIVQLSPVAVPFFITVTVRVAELPPDDAVPDNVTERFVSVEPAVNVYVLALLELFMFAEAVALPYSDAPKPGTPACHCYYRRTGLLAQ